MSLKSANWEAYQKGVNQIKYKQDLGYFYDAKPIRPHRKDTNYIPPWMAQKRAEEYLESHAPLPDDFGIPEFVTTAQWKSMHERDCAYEDTVERRIAWKLFARNVSDCICGKQKSRLLYIAEISKWVNAEEGEFVYDFEYWAAVLGFDVDWARGKFNKFLTQAKSWAIMEELPENIKSLLKEVVGKFKSRPSSSRESNTGVNQQRAKACQEAQA